MHQRLLVTHCSSPRSCCTRSYHYHPTRSHVQRHALPPGVATSSLAFFLRTSHLPPRSPASRTPPAHVDHRRPAVLLLPSHRRLFSDQPSSPVLPSSVSPHAASTAASFPSVPTAFGDKPPHRPHPTTPLVDLPSPAALSWWRRLFVRIFPPDPSSSDGSASVADLSTAALSPRSSSSSSSSSSSAPTSSLTSMSVHSQNKTLRYAFVGNVTICTLKLTVWLLTSSQAMFAEFLHTSVDTMNQALLLLGAQQAQKQPDHRHQMGYGRAPYFFSLISALNLFWFGVVFNTYHTFMLGSHNVSLHWYTWAVLGLSFLIDGTVLRVSLQELNRNRPAGRSGWKHWKQLKNPLVIGTIMEDVAAVSGVVIAGVGIGLSHLTGSVLYDHIASLSISTLLLYTSYALVRTNYKYLLGFSLSPTVQHNITQLIKARPSVQCVYTVRGEWTSSDQFAFRCGLDFDGAYFSHLLEQAYTDEFRRAAVEGGKELKRVMGLFAEDVTRLVEEEVVMIEQAIRAVYPQAAFIELECAGESSWRMALAADQARRGAGEAEAEPSAPLLQPYNKRLTHKGREKKEEATRLDERR